MSIKNIARVITQIAECPTGHLIYLYVTYRLDEFFDRYLPGMHKFI